MSAEDKWTQVSYSIIGLLGPDVQSIVSLTSSFRGQFAKCFRTF